MLGIAGCAPRCLPLSRGLCSRLLQPVEEKKEAAPEKEAEQEAAAEPAAASAAAPAAEPIKEEKKEAAAAPAGAISAALVKVGALRHAEPRGSTKRAEPGSRPAQRLAWSRWAGAHVLAYAAPFGPCGGSL